MKPHFVFGGLLELPTRGGSKTRGKEIGHVASYDSTHVPDLPYLGEVLCHGLLITSSTNVQGGECQRRLLSKGGGSGCAIGGSKLNWGEPPPQQVNPL